MTEWTQQGQIDQASFRTINRSRSRRLIRIERMVAHILHHASWRLQRLEAVWPLVREELTSPRRLPWHRRWRLWRRGFLSQSHVLYDFDRNDPSLYLSDYRRLSRTKTINGPYASILDSKLTFNSMLHDHTELLPATYGLIVDGRFVPSPKHSAESGDATQALRALIRRQGKLVLKPVRGGGGEDVYLLSDVGNRLFLNGRILSEAGLSTLVAASDDSLVTEFVVQHERLAQLYRRATNTIRIVTVQDELCPPYVAAAVLRIGRRQSEPVDNWLRGGLSAKIDTATGRLGVAAAAPDGADDVPRFARHPESDAVIEGVEIPHWSRIGAEVRRLCRSLPYLKYVGWDIIVTEDGFRILEGNNYSSIGLIQVHGPMLVDETLCAFFRRHGVIGR